MSRYANCLVLPVQMVFVGVVSRAIPCQRADALPTLIAILTAILV